jgi:hypothetical protein
MADSARGAVKGRCGSGARGVWEVRVVVGNDPTTGVSKQRSFTVNGEDVVRERRRELVAQFGVDRRAIYARASLLSHRFGRLRDRAAVPDAALHQIRHAVATALVEDGKILTARARLRLPLLGSRSWVAPSPLRHSALPKSGPISSPASST